MAMKEPLTIAQQLQRLKDRGMLFKSEEKAIHFLSTISYYRLKGYWWDMQFDKEHHLFKPHSYFETVIEYYNFDRHLKSILFDAIERIEIALRTKIIYYMSLSFGALWHFDEQLFNNKKHHASFIKNTKREFNYSNETFIKDHKQKHGENAFKTCPSWKILEIVSMGNLSKLYKNIRHNAAEKSKIANEMGLNLHSELSSWLEAIVYVRNIIAHHSRLWSRNMIKKPKYNISNPMRNWLDMPLSEVQHKKLFLIICTLIYLSNVVAPKNKIKHSIKELIKNNPNIPIYKLGFLGNWQTYPLWR